MGGEPPPRPVQQFEAGSVTDASHAADCKQPVGRCAAVGKGAIERGEVRGDKAKVTTGRCGASKQFRIQAAYFVDCNGNSHVAEPRIYTVHIDQLVNPYRLEQPDSVRSSYRA